jgi:hypothetical protein
MILTKDIEIIWFIFTSIIWLQDFDFFISLCFYLFLEIFEKFLIYVSTNIL